MVLLTMTDCRVNEAVALSGHMEERSSGIRPKWKSRAKCMSLRTLVAAATSRHRRLMDICEYPPCTKCRNTTIHRVVRYPWLSITDFVPRVSIHRASLVLFDDSRHAEIFHGRTSTRSFHLDRSWSVCPFSHRPSTTMPRS
jgi:hypothetical protein